MKLLILITALITTTSAQAMAGFVMGMAAGSSSISTKVVVKKVNMGKACFIELPFMDITVKGHGVFFHEVSHTSSLNINAIEILSPAPKAHDCIGKKYNVFANSCEKSNSFALVITAQGNKYYLGKSYNKVRKLVDTCRKNKYVGHVPRTR